jgi:nucleotide-binding universal stress UspA family protein
MVIVVGYVPKPEGRAALDRAVDEANLRGGRLVVVNASRGDAYVDAGYAGEEEIELVKARLADAGVEHEIRQLVRGHEPAEEVVELADQVGAELIVIGMRHRTAVGKFLLGSTAQRILLDAHCPVLAVKADDTRPGRSWPRPGSTSRGT